VDIHYIGFSLLSFSHKIAANLTFAPFDNEIRAMSDRYFWFNYTHPETIGGPWMREEDIRLRLIERMIERECPTSEDLVIWSDLDETPWPLGMRWVIDQPPKHYYRFLGYFSFYNYRWRSPNPWQWAYVMRFGGKHSDRNWFKYRTPDHPPFEYVLGAKDWGPGTQSLFHCTYCFPSLGQIIEKLKSFSHSEFSTGKYIDPNYIYAHVYCGHSIFGGNHTLVDFNAMGVYVPDDDARFDYLKMRLSFNDLDKFKFDIKALREYAPCELDFLKGKTELPPLPNHIR
jgi:hypothetical protein